jgi:hypothetical protein
MKHRPYTNLILDADYCEACGDEYPCLPARQANPRCLCSHALSVHEDGTECWTPACGCARYRAGEVA